MSSIEGKAGESATSCPKLFRSNFKLRETLENEGRCSGFVFQQERNISCNAGVLNREFLGIDGRELSESSNATWSQKWIATHFKQGLTQHKMPDGVIIHKRPRHPSHVENFRAADRECPDVVRSCQLASPGHAFRRLPAKSATWNH